MNRHLPDTWAHHYVEKQKQETPAFLCILLCHHRLLQLCCSELWSCRSVLQSPENLHLNPPTLNNEFTFLGEIYSRSLGYDRYGGTALKQPTPAKSNSRKKRGDHKWPGVEQDMSHGSWENGIGIWKSALCVNSLNKRLYWAMVNSIMQNFERNYNYFDLQKASLKDQFLFYLTASSSLSLNPSPLLSKIDPLMICKGPYLEAIFLVISSTFFHSPKG